MKKYQTIKIWETTLSNLRLLAGMKEQSIVTIIDTLINRAVEIEKYGFTITPNQPSHKKTKKHGNNTK